MSEKYIPESISGEQLKAMEVLFKDNLPPSPILLEEYEIICEKDETAKELLVQMIKKCVDYTVDVSNMERYAREHPAERGDDREAVDRKRSATHDATIASIDIFCRYIGKNLYEPSFITWDTSNRGAYGKFAILLSLNLFKEKIILDLVKEKVHREEIDIQKLKESAVGQELLVLDYVDILCTAEKEDRTVAENEAKKLKEIEDKLNQTADKILGAFHQIYIKRY
jgi:hypothetical protein